MSEYVVVIEVDNKRASAAYQKGLADLDLIWPQLMEHAKKVDDERRAKYEKEEESARIAQKLHDAAVKKYYEDVKEWESKSTFLRSRGPHPEYPGGFFRWSGLSDFPYKPSYLRDHYESVRKELQRKADLAGAAISPFRMPEREVERMVAWEDGSAIEEMKNREAVAMPYVL